MKNIGLLLLVLALSARSAMAAQGEGQMIARVCAVDFKRLCAERVPVPAIADFRDGGLINQCLKEKIDQLSNPCWFVITGGGR